MKDVKVLGVKWFYGSIGIVKIEKDKQVSYKIGYSEALDEINMISEIVEYGDNFRTIAGDLVFEEGHII